MWDSHSGSYVLGRVRAGRVLCGRRSNMLVSREKGVSYVEVCKEEGARTRTYTAEFSACEAEVDCLADVTEGMCTVGE